MPVSSVPIIISIIIPSSCGNMNSSITSRMRWSSIVSWWSVWTVHNRSVWTIHNRSIWTIHNRSIWTIHNRSIGTVRSSVISWRSIWTIRSIHISATSTTTFFPSTTSLCLASSSIVNIVSMKTKIVLKAVIFFMFSPL